MAVVDHRTESGNIEVEQNRFSRQEPDKREEKLSVEEMGLKFLADSLKEMRFEGSFEYESVFGMLSEGDVEEAFKVLTEAKG